MMRNNTAVIRLADIAPTVSLPETGGNETPLDTRTEIAVKLSYYIEEGSAAGTYIASVRVSFPEETKNFFAKLLGIEASGLSYDLLYDESAETIYITPMAGN